MSVVRRLRSGCRGSAVNLCELKTFCLGPWPICGLKDNLFRAVANQYQSCVVQSTGRLNTWGKRYCGHSSGGKRLKYKGKRYCVHSSGGKRLNYKGKRYCVHSSVVKGSNRRANVTVCILLVVKGLAPRANVTFCILLVVKG